MNSEPLTVRWLIRRDVDEALELGAMHAWDQAWFCTWLSGWACPKPESNMLSWMPDSPKNNIGALVPQEVYNRQDCGLGNKRVLYCTELWVRGSEMCDFQTTLASSE